MKNNGVKHDIICFDVDSTLVTIEGVDFLAEQKGIGEEVKRLTELSMNGTVAMEEVFGKKLDLLAPTKKELQGLGQNYCQTLCEDTEIVIAALHSLSKEVWLVTGSFRTAVEPLAKKLKIPLSRLCTNEVFFNPQGDYAGIDYAGPLTTTGGKALCVKKLSTGKKIAFVGDSVTDLATQPSVTTFVGYGGVVMREKVARNTLRFITCQSLAPLLLYVLTKDEQEMLETTKFAALLAKARRLSN